MVCIQWRSFWCFWILRVCKTAMLPLCLVSIVWASKKKGTLRFLWPLQQFGDKTEHFGGICSALEVEPLASKDIEPGNLAFACFGSILWTCCEHVGARRCRFNNICNTFGVRTEHFRWLVLNLFKIGSGFLRVDLGLSEIGLSWRVI